MWKFLELIVLGVIRLCVMELMNTEGHVLLFGLTCKWGKHLCTASDLYTTVSGFKFVFKTFQVST